MLKTLSQNFLIYLHSKNRNKFSFITPQNILKDVSNVLVLIPEQKELTNEIKFIFNVTQQLFNQVTFLVEANLSQFLQLDDHPNVIIYDQKQKNFIDLPKKHFIHLLQQKKYDLIIDCNIKDSFFHYWIQKNLNAKYKLGLYRENSTLFNNLVMRVNNIENVKRAYKNLLLLLKL